MLKRFINRIANPPRCLELDSIDPRVDQSFSLQGPVQTHASADVIPYIIQQRAYGRGLLSLASAVVCHVHVAHRYRLTPYVDLRSHYTEYKDADFENSPECTSDNPWEYYFKPVSQLTTAAPADAPLRLYSSLGFPLGYPRKMLVSQVQSLRDIASRILQPVDSIGKDVAAVMQQLRAPVLAVHFRGQEQKTMPYHPLSPTRSQIFAAIDKALDQHGFASIFLATEDLDYHDILKSRYGERLISMPHFRTRAPVNAYRINPRPMHRYLLGREILTDTLIMSQCDGLVSSTSNVTEIARAINNGAYRLDLVIDNGLNVHHALMAKYFWTLKRCLPGSMGGFNNSAIVAYPQIS